MKGWRTIAAAAAIAVAGLVEQSGVINLIPQEYHGLAIAAAGLVMAGMRFVTRTPVGRSD
jgi:hypothetical protein